MSNMVRIGIVGSNRFFALGIQQILLPYFRARGQVVRFVRGREMGHANLVFLSVIKGWPLQLCRHYSLETQVLPVFIAFRGTQIAISNRCLREQGSLWLRVRPEALLLLVEQGLKEQAQGNFILQELCSYCMSVVLTDREQEVMRYLSCEQAQKSLPKHLNISHKTVSAHKRSVMRKLGFRRNTELYHWLRLGGLDQIERT